MARIGMSSPWVAYYHEVEAFFREDPEVHVIFDDEKCEIKLYVENTSKAAALDKLMRHEMNYGNVTLAISVIQRNGVMIGLMADVPNSSLYQNALEGNKAFSYIRTIQGVFVNGLTYVVFANKVVQYWTDDLGDINGIRSTLYQDIAKEIFAEREGVFFNTDVEKEETGILHFRAASAEWP